VRHSQVLFLTLSDALPLSLPIKPLHPVQVPSKSSPSTAATARISHSMPPNAAAEESARTANLDPGLAGLTDLILWHMDRRICFTVDLLTPKRFKIRSSSRLPKCQTVTKVSVHALSSDGEVWHCPSHRPYHQNSSYRGLTRSDSTTRTKTGKKIWIQYFAAAMPNQRLNPSA
jgi:hypothetical protein